MYITDNVPQQAHYPYLPRPKRSGSAWKQGPAVPIDSFLSNTVFEPDTITLLASAFDTAWDTLKKSGSPVAANHQAAWAREVLAKRIIEMGKKGERDPQRLVDDALAHLAGSK